MPKSPHFNKILPYFEDKEIKTKKEFEEIYDLFVDYFKGVCYTWVIPDMEDVSKDRKEKSLEMRKKTEQYASKRDNLFIRILESKYPLLKDKTKFIRKDESFSEKSEEELLEIANSRSNDFIYLNKEIILQPKIEQFLEVNNIQLEKANSYDEKNRSLSGKAAYGGKIRGIARIVFTHSDLDKILNKSDILVTPMTRPDFVPAIKKAGAIITDEGGLLCHAVIVARELKKPCIIGTKIATKVLKDEDEVEVDAEKGIIKVLERA